VSPIDWLIVAFCALLAFYGYVQGFIVGALSLVGFIGGALLGTRLGPLILSGGSRSQYAPLFGLLGALLAGGILATGFEGLGLRVRRALRVPGLHTVDGLLGATLTACVGLGVAWIVGAVALQSSGSPSLRRDIQRSAILRELNQLLPPSGPILHALARFDPLPAVSGPTASVPPPNRGILAVPAVRAAFPSVVKVVGTACGLGIEGSGWVAAPDLVVTNAHVVAGEQDTTVQTHDGTQSFGTELVDFDVHDDVAVLRVPGLDERSLPLAPGAPPGRAVAILGYPLDGPFDAEPGRVGQTETAATDNAYGNGPVLRSVLELRGLVRPGNSGGPLVDAQGDVLGTVFAAITGGPGNSGGDGLAVPNSIVATQLAKAEHAGVVSSGPCAG
jgi:S1-C subfamily serine protease